MIKVFIIESERGWGQRVEETKEFTTSEAARKFCIEYNREYNPPGKAPAWYMYAKMEGDNAIGILR